MGTKPPTPPGRRTLRCPRCRNTDIVMSLPRHFLDEVMRGFGRTPRHCRYCGKRFYVFDRPAPAGDES